MREKKKRQLFSRVRWRSSCVLALASFLCISACTHVIHGHAALPLNNRDLAQDPEVTNIGVDGPLTVPGSSQRIPAGSDPHASMGTMTLKDYFQSHNIDISPIPAGGGLTATIDIPPGWTVDPQKPADTQISIEFKSNSALVALMFVNVLELSRPAPVQELISSAKNTLSEEGSTQETNESDYLGHSSYAAVILINTENGTRLMKINRLTFVSTSSSVYVVNSVIACLTDQWTALRTNLLNMDSSVDFS